MVGWGGLGWTVLEGDPENHPSPVPCPGQKVPIAGDTTEAGLLCVTSSTP